MEDKIEDFAMFLMRYVLFLPAELASKSNCKIVRFLCMLTMFPWFLTWIYTGIPVLILLIISMIAMIAMFVLKK